MPAAAVASRTPSRAGMSGTVFGASGEMEAAMGVCCNAQSMMAGLTRPSAVRWDRYLKEVAGGDKRHRTRHAYFFAGGAGIAGVVGVAGLSSRSTFAV